MITEPESSALVVILTAGNESIFPVVNVIVLEPARSVSLGVQFGKARASANLFMEPSWDWQGVDRGPSWPVWEQN